MSRAKTGKNKQAVKIKSGKKSLQKNTKKNLINKRWANVKVPEITIPRVEVGPGIKIDGKLSEQEWKKALIIENFKRIGPHPKLAGEQTEIKLLYDTQAIYLGCTFHESKMNSLVAGIPQGQTVDAPINSGGDCGELLIAPDKNDLKHYYHLRFNPRGGKNDQLITNRIEETGLVGLFFNGNEHWNGKWEVATSTKKDRWIAEIKIYFSSFAKEGEFFGTPVPGTVWRVNFCRAEAPHGEFSAWSPPNPGLFHIPAYFGRLKFGKWRFGEIVLTDVNPGPMSFGKNIFRATVQSLTNRKAKVDVKAYLTEEVVNKREMIKKIKKCYWKLPSRTTLLLKKSLSLSPGDKRQITFPYIFSYGGKKEIAVFVGWERMLGCIYKG
ncbi:MAG: hypothetical protein D6707_08170, partial [Bacteroidetes bacterium]